MNIRCDNCATNHELDPPSWVLSSGRPFRFRCSDCGHAQMIDPSASPPEPDPIEESPAVEPSAGPLRGPQSATLAPVEETPEVSTNLEESSGTVYLKQDGTVYLVRDWATLQRWIMERRIGREDLVSEGGVRWEPIGSRPELGSFFAAVERLEAAEVGTFPPAHDAPFPVGGETPFAVGGSSSGSLHDDDTGGIPTGLPPLPTEEVAPVEGGTDYPQAPPSRGMWEPDEPALAFEDDDEDLAGALRFDDSPEELSLDDDLSLETPFEEASPPLMLETPGTAPPRFEGDAETLPPTPAPLNPPKPSFYGENDDDDTGSDVADLDLDFGEPADDGDLSFEDLASEESEEPLFRDFGAYEGDDDSEEWEYRRKKLPTWVLLVAVLATFLIGTAIIWVVFVHDRPTDEVPDEPQAGLEQVIPPRSDDAVADAATPEATPEPTPEPTPEATPEPTPEATPRATPAPPPLDPVPRLIERGWTQVDGGQLSSAARTFADALRSAPDNPEAHYGYGYVMLQKGATDEATHHLCAVIAGGADAGLKGEVRGVLGGAGLACP